MLFRSHAPEFMAVTNQFINLYKRLWGGGEAPSYVSWGHNNRSALVRVPLYKPNKMQAARIEYRGLDSASNPYLAYAVILAAGLKGIEHEYELMPAVTEDLSRFQVRIRIVKKLPAPSPRCARTFSYFSSALYRMTFRSNSPPLPYHHVFQKRLYIKRRTPHIEDRKSVV